MERALDLIDESKQCKGMYKVNVLSAIRALIRIWEDLEPHVISNSWRHTKLRSGSEGTEGHRNTFEGLEEECQVLQDQISSMVPVHARMSVERFLNSPGEEEFVEKFNEEEILFEQTPEDPGDTSKADTVNELTSLLSSLKGQLTILATSQRILQE